MDGAGPPLTPARARARGLAGALFALGIALLASGHVGSSNAYFEGEAGPYPVRVIVRTPGVIPGLAQISVRITGGELPARVTVRPLRWDAGLEGAPPPDTARAVAGEVGLYAAELWLMTFGSYSVRVEVAGPLGEGVALVPVNAVAERRLEMGTAMAVGLLGFALFLFVGAVTIFGAAVRESVLEPGARPDDARRRRAGIAMGVGAVVLGVLLWGGWTWWGAVDQAYRDAIYRPLSTSSSVSRVDGPAVLTLEIDDPEWLGRQWTPLMPDHGKLMHMFLVRDGDLAAFAHVHPESVDSASFEVALPPLPAGAYRIYADVVHESGFAQTLVDTVEVRAGPSDPSAAPGRDPDDSWAALPPLGDAPATRFTLSGGHTLEWSSGLRPAVDEEVTLAFRVRRPDGAPAALEPYMGMLSHAAVTTHDGTVFMHVHPAGSINMAAQQRFVAAEPGGAPAPDMDATAAGRTVVEPGTVAFPFVFPRPGRYRIFVQVKVDGVVETAAFDAEVPGT